MNRFKISTELSCRNISRSFLCNSMTEVIENKYNHKDFHIMKDFYDDHSISFRSWGLNVINTGYSLHSPLLNYSNCDLEYFKFIMDSFRNKVKNNKIIHSSSTLRVYVDLSQCNLRTINNLIKLFYIVENFIFDIQPFSRRQNDACRALRTIPKYSLEKFFDIFNIRDDSLFFLIDYTYGINYSLFPEREYAVISYSNGSIRSDKILNWVGLILILTEISKKEDLTLDIKNRSDLSKDEILDFIFAFKLKDELLESKKKNILNWCDFRYKTFEKLKEKKEKRCVD
ncbi:MAG: hypothetical protein ACOCV1_02520 [Bacillota bacterium]